MSHQFLTQKPYSSQYIKNITNDNVQIIPTFSWLQVVYRITILKLSEKLLWMRDDVPTNSSCFMNISILTILGHM